MCLQWTSHRTKCTQNSRYAFKTTKTTVILQCFVDICYSPTVQCTKGNGGPAHRWEIMSNGKTGQHNKTVVSL